MNRDFKIGLFAGLVMLIAAVVWLATRPSLDLRHLYLRNLKPALQLANQAAPDGNAPDKAPAATEGQLHDSNPDDVDWTIYRQIEKVKTQKFHIVRKNETLSDIARQYYGSAAKWPKIYNANRDIIKNPHSLRPGTKLLIPD